MARGEGQKIEMIYTAPHEFFFTKLKLALFGAVFLAFPIIAYQIYKFVAPGLYKNEREAFRPYLLWTFLLFILGALVVYFIVMPLAMMFFLSMEQTGGQVEIHLQAQGERVSLPDHDADPGLRHHVPAAGGADAAGAGRHLSGRRTSELPPLCHRRHHGAWPAFCRRPIPSAWSPWRCRPSCSTRPAILRWIAWRRRAAAAQAKAQAAACGG